MKSYEKNQGGIEKTPQKTTPLEGKILTVIKEKQTITKSEIARKLNLSEETIKEYLAKLKNKGFLERISPDKGGYWEVKE